MAKSTLLLDAHLKALRLPTFLREYDKVARHCAQEGLDCPRDLFRLCELELLDREQRAIERRIKAAKFPVVKSLETFAFRAIPSLNKRLVLELTRAEYLDRRENVLALGNSGTGKTHLALALGLTACQKGYRVRFTTAAALVNELLEARDDKRLLRFRFSAGRKREVVMRLLHLEITAARAALAGSVSGCGAGGPVGCRPRSASC